MISFSVSLRADQTGEGGSGLCVRVQPQRTNIQHRLETREEQHTAFTSKQTGAGDPVSDNKMVCFHFQILILLCFPVNPN